MQKTPVDKPASVQEWAANSAADILLFAWEEAIERGSNPRDLIADVDEVCAILNRWKKVVLVGLTKQKMGGG